MANRFTDPKVGDMVAIPYNDGDVKQGEVSKVTPTQIIVADRRYRRSDGAEVGPGRSSVRPWTTEHAEQAARFKASRRLSDASYELNKIAARGFRQPITNDTTAATALADQIEAYVKSQKEGA